MLKSNKRMNSSFTLLELMVVIAIIGLLISILLPSLSKAKEKTIRAVCLSQQSQFHKILFMIAKDDNNLLPDGVRNNGQEHTMFIGGKMMERLINYEVAKEVLGCPNLPLDIVMNTFDKKIRYGYFGNRPNIIASNGYELPTKLTDESYLPLLADVNDNSTANRWTAIGHIKDSGGKWMDDTGGALATSLGAAGGNIIFLNGNGKWFDIKSLQIYNSYQNSTRRTMWTYDR